MKLAIFGSRTICDDDAKEELRQLIKEANPTAIVTAAQPEGVCALARELAQELVLPLHLHFLDPHRAQGMHEWRSVAVYNDCDHVILMHDGESRGTQNELKLAIKMSVPYAYRRREATPQPEPDEEDKQIEELLKNML